MQDWTQDNRQSQRYTSFFNFDTFDERPSFRQKYTTNIKANEFRMSITNQTQNKKPVRIRMRNVSMEIKPKQTHNKIQIRNYQQSEYYDIQTPKNSIKENQFSSFKSNFLNKNQQEKYGQKYQYNVQNERNSYYESLKDSQLRNSLINQKESFVYQKNQIKEFDEIKLEKKSTVDTEQDSYKSRQQILEDIQRRFKTPHKIQDLLNYLSNEFNYSSYSEKNSIDENTLLSSQKSTQEDWYNNTADSFNSLKKKYSLINKTYSQNKDQDQGNQKFDLKFYSVYNKLNERKFTNPHNYDLQIQPNEFKTNIDFVDTQKFLQEVKESLSQKDVNYYVHQLKRKQTLSNQFQQMNIVEQEFLFQGWYRFIPKDADELFTWEFFNKYRVENYLPFFNNPFVLNVKTTWIMDPNSRFPHTNEYIIKRAICHDKFDDFVKYIKKVDINKPIDFENNLTPLHLAAKLNKILVLKYLIMKGADLNVQNQYGSTPLMEALNEMSFDSIKALVENGANINIKDNYGIDVINKAKFKEYHSIQKYLQEKNEQKIFKLQRFIQRPQFMKDCLIAIRLINESQIQKYGKPLNYPFNDLRKNYLISFMNKEDF